MLRLFLTLAVVAALWWFLFRFNKGSTAQQKQMLTKFLLYGLAGLLLLLVVTGRAHWLFAVVGAAIPWLQRLLVIKNVWNSFKPKSASVPSSGKQSKVSSEYLEMSLDHDSGQMDGTVLKGNFQGQELKNLELEQLLIFMSECLPNMDSQNLLKAYLDFRFADEWRNQASDDAGNQQQPGNTPMSSSEALAILGLDQGATKDEITQAHKKLMQRLHPDRGGSEYLASKINQAKDLLLP